MPQPPEVRPFADAVVAYAQAGWPCILPVPVDKKFPPPAGFTGADGRDTDPMQLVTWAGSHAAHAIALRMPDDIIGIDVDHYDKTVMTPEGPKTVQKRGAETLAEFEERWGPLPRTWSSTARGDGRGPGPSRILFFRVPPGRYATHLGDAIEIIQRHHRYAVVAPSPHPETANTYGWYDPTDRPVLDAVPKPTELLWLPQTWVQNLAEGATEAGPAAADIGSGYALLDAIMADTRPACAEVTSAALAATAQMSAAASGSRHDTATARVHHLVQLAAAGHPGAGSVLDEVRLHWTALTAGEDRGGEFERMMLTSARKAVTAIRATRPVDRDPCLFANGVVWAPPVPADDRPGAAPERAPALVWSIRQVIGVHAFDPLADLDQTLAQAVLERTWPALRYAYDANTWLLRGPDRWDPRGDLAGWAVAELAALMPAGNPEAERGTEDRRRAERRKRLMSTTGASGVAAKVRALTAAGTHPCTLRMETLDTDPEVLWAGGLAWQLRHSTMRPAEAGLDPATPHLHSAGFAPDPDRPTALWDAFLAAVWPDASVRAWALRVLSITLTGYPDAALPILYGSTRRGKSQVVALLMSVLGTYAHAADPRLLGGTEQAHASIVHALKGRRLSFIDEGPRRGFGAQERLKQLTGGTDLTGNRMRENPVTFTPTHTLVLTANPEAEIALTDPAIRARVRLIPCEGDEDAVRKARAAIGPLSGPMWQAEAPGVLALMMREAAAWLADRGSATTAAAPASIRSRADDLAEEQDPVRQWLVTETVPDPGGCKASGLYAAFVAWCRGMEVKSIPSQTRWGTALTAAGHDRIRREDGVYRPIRLRAPGSSWSPHQAAAGDGSQLTPVTERDEQRARPGPTHAAGETQPGRSPAESGVAESLSGPVTAPAGASRAEKRSTRDAGGPTESAPNPSGEGTLTRQVPGVDLRLNSSCTVPEQSQTQPYRSQNPSSEAVFGRLAEQMNSCGSTSTTTNKNKDQIYREKNTREEQAAPSTVQETLPNTVADLGKGPLPNRSANCSAAHSDEPAFATARTATGRVSIDKKLIKARQQQIKVDEVGGEPVRLPALVGRTGAPASLDPAAAGPALAAAIERSAALTVDVETTGYPVGHRHYALRTIQLGDDHAAVVFDAADPTQRHTAALALAAAPRLHAHSATADLVPLADAGLIDLETAWAKMYDTVIPAKLADPASTGSDPGLKQLARAVLGDQAVAPGADADRATLFKTGRWLTDTKMTTSPERSGWAQVDMHRATMVRYGAADVLDTAALVRVLPPVEPAVLHRERTAQRLTARVAHQGLRIDGAHVTELLAQHTALRAAAAGRVRAFGIDNPGSDRQVAAALTERGAILPRTPPSAKFPQGQPSVAEGVLDPLLRQHPEGSPLHGLVRAVLDYRHHDTAIGTFLEPYQQLVHHGDGRARPTVYTLAADTGRMSCVRPNLQQVPRQGGFRACITADPGHLLVSADFSGVELRVAAALSGDSNLYQIITEGDANKKNDLHWRIAREVFGPDATKEDRYAAKRVVFGRLYGGGIPTLARQAGVTESVAASAVDVLDAMTPGLANWSHQLRQAVRAGRTQFPAYSGRIIHLPPAYPHKAGNYCVQGTARELLVDALLRWADTRWGTAVLLPVHDEIVTVIPEDEATDALAALVAAMETELFGVQIKADPSVPTFAWADSS